MRKYLLLSFVFALISLLSSCQKEESVAEYIPFRSEKDGKWGFINLDGDVLLEDEFKREPTIVSMIDSLLRIKQGIGRCTPLIRMHDK